MGANWTHRLGTALGVLAAAFHSAVAADELPPLPTPAGAAARPATEKPVPPVRAQTPSPKPDAPAAKTDGKAGVDDPTGLDEVSAARSETSARLEKLPPDKDKAATPATRALREALEDRLRWLDEWDKAVKERLAAEHPEPSPEKLDAEWKTDLERVKATLDQTVREPDLLLPVAFRKAPAGVPDALRAEMKEAIGAAQAELKEWAGKLEQFRAEPSRKPGAGLAGLRADRDKVFQRVASVKARNVERAAAAAEARTPEARSLAREKLTNDQWEARVESERLRGREAQIALETRRAELDGLNQQVLEAHVLFAQRVLERMTGIYHAASARQESALHRAAANEQTRAEKSADPVERFRAKRAGEILEIEAGVLKCENYLTTNPRPSFEEQRALADQAETDFTAVKHLLDDGTVSHLDALRLNSDFRRIGAERARIVRNELAAATGRLSAAESALGAVENEIIYDSRDDRYELDNLLERLPKASHPKALAIHEEFEKKHLALLARRRAALEKIASRAELTHDQVLRRLRILDDHFGFIRTNLFWVRDEPTIGIGTLNQAQREARQLARASLRIAAEVCDRSNWGRISPEFLIASLGLVVTPWPLRRLRRSLRAAVHDVPSPIATAPAPAISPAPAPDHST